MKPVIVSIGLKSRTSSFHQILKSSMIYQNIWWLDFRCSLIGQVVMVSHPALVWSVSQQMIAPNSNVINNNCRGGGWQDRKSNQYIKKNGCCSPLWTLSETSRYNNGKKSCTHIGRLPFLSVYCRAEDPFHSCRTSNLGYDKFKRNRWTIKNVYQWNQTLKKMNFIFSGWGHALLPSIILKGRFLYEPNSIVKSKIKAKNITSENRTRVMIWIKKREGTYKNVLFIYWITL